MISAGYIALDKQMWNLVLKNLTEQALADLRPCGHFRRFLGCKAAVQDTDEKEQEYLDACLALHTHIVVKHPRCFTEILQISEGSEEGKQILDAMDQLDDLDA